MHENFAVAGARWDLLQSGDTQDHPQLGEDTKGRHDPHAASAKQVLVDPDTAAGKQLLATAAAL